MNKSQFFTKLKGNRFMQLAMKYFLLIALVFVFVIFAILNEGFGTFGNFINISRTVSFVGLLGLAAMFSMLVGEFDFSVASQATLCAAIVGTLLDSDTFHNYFLACIAGILVVMFFSFVSATFIIKLKMPAFITTLTMSIIMDAIVSKFVNKNALFSNKWPDTYTIFRDVEVFGIPLPIVAALAIFAAAWYITEKTKLGRHMFAVGSNPQASAQTGLNVDKYKYIAFLIIPVLTGIAGIMQSSIYSQVTFTLGSDYHMFGICVAILSTTFLKNGRHNVPGVLVGTYLLVTITNGMSNMGLPTSYSNIAQAVIMIITVGIIARVKKNGLPTVSFY